MVTGINVVQRPKVTVFLSQVEKQSFFQVQGFVYINTGPDDHCLDKDRSHDLPLLWCFIQCWNAEFPSLHSGSVAVL